LKPEFKQDQRSEIISDLMKVYSLASSNVMVENVEVTEENRAALGEKMRKLDPSGNRRVGMGEASIYNHLISMRDLFKNFIILSEDKDVSYLFMDIEGVQVLG